MTEIFVALFVAVVIASVHGHDCLSGFHQFNGSCYWLSRGTQDFAGASSTCRELGAHLAIISSKKERDFLKGYAKTRGGAYIYWVGGSDLVLEDHWMWSNRKPVDLEWSPTQPNEGNKANCLCLWNRYGYKIADHGCTYKGNYICEYKVPK